MEQRYEKIGGNEVMVYNVCPRTLPTVFRRCTKSQNGTYPVRRKVLTVHIHIAAKHIDHERNLFIVPI